MCAKLRYVLTVWLTLTLLIAGFCLLAKKGVIDATILGVQVKGGTIYYPNPGKGIEIVIEQHCHKSKK